MNCRCVKYEGGAMVQVCEYDCKNIPKCSKCRTEDFENCHSIKCPMRKHGGKREGAGRKPLYAEETQTISFRVPKSLIEPITKYVKRALAKSKK